MPSQDSPPPRSQRPTIDARRSTSSASKSYQQTNNGELPNSPGVAPLGSSHKARTHGVKHHVVGHGRVQPRPPSYGKNLNKLTKIVGNEGGGAVKEGKRHKRSHSHTPSTSPRIAQSNRNGSNISLKRNGSQSSLKENHSHASLNRPSSRPGERNDDAVTKPSRLDDASGIRGSFTHRNTAVRFDLGGDQDDGWTEASSATDSPNAARSTTNNSRVNSRPESPIASRTNIASLPTTPPASVPRDIPIASPTVSTSQKRIADHSRTTPPSADAITSRLLGRHPQHPTAPQTTIVSATATPSSRSPRTQFSHLNRSNTTASHQTRSPNGSSLPSNLPFSASPPTLGGDQAFTPNSAFITPQSGQTPSARFVSQSSTNSGGAFPSSGNPHPSTNASTPSTGNSAITPPTRIYRTQQKILLQRASSTLEPHTSHGIGSHATLLPLRPSSSTIPSSHSVYTPPLARVGNIQTTPGGGFYIGDGQRELLRQYERCSADYGVVRRFRSPIAESVARIGMRDKVGPKVVRRERRGDEEQVRRLRELGLGVGSVETGGSAGSVERELGDGEVIDGGTEDLLRRMWERADVPIDRDD